MPIAGNLLHHAFEMFLKGALSPDSSLQQLKKIGHDLVTLWQSLKKQNPSGPPPGLEATLRELDKFEDLRYPDRVLQSEILMWHEFKHETGMVLTEAELKRRNQYTLRIADIDNIVRFLFVVAQVSPENHFGQFGAELRKYLIEKNEYASYFMPA
jgi:hypothetical protein